MINEISFEKLVEPACNWFIEHKRDLPWRKDRDPYHIWVSEIMLQQTRVEAVKSYYARFMEALPTIEDLAKCPEDQLLKLWEGLGYYNRVRNMQRAAQVIVEEYHGRMPDGADEILALPGIGPYTAGAIGSIAYNLPTPAVDGNVLRIIARVSDDDSDILKEKTKRAVTEALSQVMPSALEQGVPGLAEKSEAMDLTINGILNQALMEIGALVCVPNGQPHCQECPWQEMCLAKQRNTIDQLPVKKKAKARKVVDMTVFLIRDGGKVMIRKRPKKGLLAGLYEFPNVEGTMNQQDVVEFVRQHGLDPLRVEEITEAKHIFSHVEWHMKGYMVHVASVEAWSDTVESRSIEDESDVVETKSTEDESDVVETKSRAENLLVELDEIETAYALPSAFKKYAEVLNLSIGKDAKDRQ